MPVFETQSTVITSVDSGANGKETMNNSQSSTTSEVQFAAVPYHTRNECSFSKTHHVDDLTTFQSWMREGLIIRVFLQKATFIKENEATTTSSRPTSTTRPSSSKKEKPPEKVNVVTYKLVIPRY